MNQIDLIDENNKLRKELKSKWINVKDRLPDKNMKCLCCVLARSTPYIYILEYTTNLYKVDKYDFPNKKHGGFCDFDLEWGFIQYEKVTHWMPLPEPPKEATP